MIRRIRAVFAALLCFFLGLGDVHAAIRLGRNGSYLGLPHYHPPAERWVSALRSALREPLTIPDIRYAPILPVLAESGVSLEDFYNLPAETRMTIAEQADAVAKEDIGLAAATAFAKLKSLDKDSISPEEAALIAEDFKLISGELRPFVNASVAAAADIGIDIIAAEAAQKEGAARAGHKLVELASSLIVSGRAGLGDDATSAAGQREGWVATGLQRAKPGFHPYLLDDLPRLPPQPFREPPELSSALRRSAVKAAALPLAALAWAAAVPAWAFDSVGAGLIAIPIGFIFSALQYSRALVKMKEEAASRAPEEFEYDWIADAQALAQRAKPGLELEFAMDPSPGGLGSAIGGVPPKILLGDRVAHWPESVRAAVIAHEISHVIHKDLNSPLKAWLAKTLPANTWAAGAALMMGGIWGGILPAGVLENMFYSLVPSTIAYNATLVNEMWRARLKELRGDLYAVWLTNGLWAFSIFKRFGAMMKLHETRLQAFGEPLPVDWNHPTPQDRMGAIGSYASGKPLKMPERLTVLRFLRKLFS